MKSSPLPELSRRHFMRLSAATAGAATLASLGARSVLGAAASAGGGAPDPDESPSFAVLVDGSEAGPLELFPAQELGRYLQRLSGRPAPLIPVETWRRHPSGVPVVVGRAGHHRAVDEMLSGRSDAAEIGPEGFILAQANYGGVPAWLVAGQTEIGVLYGVYALLEAAGATFLLSGDLLPAAAPDFALPAIDRRGKPAFERRGFLLPFPLNLHESIWGLEDYRRLIDQMAKQRLNYLNLNLTGADPVLEYTFHGEKNRVGDINPWETGYLSPRSFFASGRTDQVEVGRERFADRPYMAPPEVQGIRSPEEVHRRLKAMFQAVFAHAAQRGVKIGFTLDPTEIPTNFARFMRRTDHVPAHRRIAGMRVDFTDPLFEAHTRAWLTALFETFPDAVDLFLWNAEGYLDYPDHGDVLARYRPQFEEARRIFEEKWKVTSPYVEKGGKTTQDVVDIDIVQMEATRRVIALARELRPGFPVGFGFLFRGYVVSSVDRIVEKDIPFIDFQSSAVIPIKDDVNAEYFAGMGERKRYIIPRIDDDGSMFGMPFYLRQFQRDGLFLKAKAAGSQGFVAQLFRARGTEHHVRFIAQGTWDPTLTPEKFYHGYAAEIFGPAAAAAMEDAFRLLEESEESLGWEGLQCFSFSGGCSEFSVLGRELLAQDDPYDGPADAASLSRRAKSRYPGIDSRVPAGEFIPDKIDHYRRSIGLLAEARNRMREARAGVSSNGRPYLEYLDNKTEAYIAHLEMAALAAQGMATYADAFIEHAGDEDRLAKALLASQAHFDQARQKARDAARIFSLQIDHPSDLAILFLANVYNIQKADRIAELVGRVVRYHQGKPYWRDNLP